MRFVLVLIIALLTCASFLTIGCTSSGIKKTVGSAFSDGKHVASNSPDKIQDELDVSYLQSPVGMTPGVDYLPNEIVVGFSTDITSDAFRLPDGKAEATNPLSFDPSSVGNAMLYENREVAEFARSLARDYGLTIVQGLEAYIHNLNFCTYRLNDGVSAEATARAIRLRYPSSVRYVQYNQLYRPCYSPNDPRWTDNSLWGISQLGAQTAWDTAQGEGVRVAVLDTGIRETHEDLAWTSIPGVNLDIIRNDEIPEDEHGHGTHVCGTVAALGNNGLGVIGAAFMAELLPIKVLNSSGYATSGSVSTGIALAAANDANVINLSLGSYSADRTTFEASLEAGNQGVLVVAAAGNDNTSYAHYPSAYPQVISVGASTRSGSKANYSNYGDTVDIAAPGGQNTQILSTTRNSFTSYGNMSGTSMASPHVAGAAAVVLSDDPTLTPHEVRSLLETTGDDIFSQSSWQSATKILRANMASALTGTVGVYPAINITSPNDGDSVTEDFVIIADASSAAGISAVLWYMDGEYLGKSSSAPYELNVGVVTLIPGPHLFTAEAIDNANMRNYSSVNITIALDPTATPYWTTVEDPPYTDGWISLNYSGSGSWQVVGTGDEEVYFGDPNKAGGPGYYVDDVDGLLSPNFDLRSMTDPYFAFEASWNLGANVYLFVRIVDSSGANDIIGALYGSNNTWPERALFSIPLTDYAGNIARIEFWIQPYTGAAEGGGVYLDNIVVTQNSAPPVVNVLAPTSNAFETGNVSVIADVVDDLGTVLLVELYDGSNLLFSTEVPPYTFDVDTTQLANGLHSFIVKAYDEMSVFGYAVAGSDGFGLIVHNTPPEVTLVSPTFGTTSAPVTITGTGFGGYYSGGGGLEGPVYNYSHIYFTGTDGPIEAGVTEITWTDTDITTTVPDGAVTGPITVEIGTLSFTTPDDFTVGAVGGMAFTAPSPKFLVTDPTQFIMTPQPFANSVEIRCAQVPGLFFVDSTPDDISFDLSPAQFARNGKYTLEATARSYAGDTTITFDFFVEKLQGDFDGNTYVEPADLTFLKSYVWLTPADDEWIPYLDWNKNGIIDEEDATIVGYNFLAHN